MHKKCATKTYFPAGKKPKVKVGTITCVNALYEIKRFNCIIIVPLFKTKTKLQFLHF